MIRVDLLAAMLAFALAALTAARPARAEDTKHACIAAADRGQVLRDQRKLRAAQGEFLACARDACPSLVRTQCADWLADVAKSTPTVVVRVTRGGADVTGVSVFVDGALLESRQGGEAVAVDPGTRHFRFVLEGEAPLERDVVVAEGEKFQKVLVSFDSQPLPEPAPTRSEPRSGPVLPAPDSSAAPTDAKHDGASPPGAEGLVAPAFEAVLRGGISMPSAILRGGSTSPLGFIALNASWRWSPLFDAGLFLGGAGGTVQLNGDVAAAAGVQAPGTFGYALAGVEGRAHVLRDRHVDGWVGIDLAGLGEQWAFTGTSPDKSFKYATGEAAAGILLGADLPLARAWAIGADIRALAATAPRGTRVSCSASCAGDLPGGSAGFQALLDFGLRLTWSIPYAR